MRAGGVFYGWWIVLVAFLNLFCTVGIIFYGFPVFYPSLIHHLGFTRAQVIEGFLVGFLAVGLPFGFLAGSLIDRYGPRRAISVGTLFVGLSLILMGHISHLWQYDLLCATEVVGYVLAGPIPNQVLIANWFVAQRGRAMGYAYLGLGLGGVVAPPLITALIHHFGWRHAMEITGALILLLLLPVGQWVTRSAPGDRLKVASGAASREDVRRAVRTATFWLLLAACTLVIGAIGVVTQHLILFLRDLGYSAERASAVASGMLLASLVGRVAVGYLVDRVSKILMMTVCYMTLALSIPLLYAAQHPAFLWAFAIVFGLAMGADYMLIPLVTAECFGLESLGRLLALIIMGYSLGQWMAPWMAGRIFDARHSYDLVWAIMTVAGVVGALTVYAIPRAGPTARPA